MAETPLRVSEAARRLDMSTRDLVVLIRERRIGYVMVDGIAHVPVGALDDYRSRTA